MKTFLSLILLASISAFAQTPIKLPDIEGPIKTATNPKGWTTYTGSPDIVEGAGIWNNSQYTLDYITGDFIGKSMVWMMFVRGSQPEAMQTEVSGLKIGEKYSVSINWQQCAMMQDKDRMYWGGDLLMIVDGDSTIFKSDGLDDDWQTATVVFKARKKSVNVVVSMYNPDYDPDSRWGGCIVVDNATAPEACPRCKEAGITK